jgi:hypothetical protein
MEKSIAITFLIPMAFNIPHSESLIAHLHKPAPMTKSKYFVAPSCVPQLILKMSIFLSLERFQRCAAHILEPDSLGSFDPRWPQKD